MTSENKDLIASTSIFYTALNLQQGSEIEIVDEEARHILQARRLEAGEGFFLTNGQGVLAQATIVHVFKKQCLYATINTVISVDYPETEIVLASAIAKGERQADYLSMATQLGMNIYIPLLCEHNIVKYQQRMKSRWQRVIAESSKQCRQCFFPGIESQQDLQTIISNSTDDELVIVAEADGMSLSDLQKAMVKKYSTMPRKIILLVGPEGGFSEREKHLLTQKGVLSACLSKHVLRIETAVVAMISTVNQIIMNQQENKF